MSAPRCVRTSATHSAIVVSAPVVIAFLAIQDRVDRRDPKLAQAPLRAEPEYLEFR